MTLHPFRGTMPTVHPDAWIAPSADVIGDTEIGASSSIWYGAVLRGDVMPIRIGARTSIQDNSVVHTTDHWSPCVVGDDCTVGHCAHLEACDIRDGALVGSNSTVLHAAVVESGALVGANALVPGGMVVPARAMALGVPAKIRPDAVDPDVLIVPGAQSYVERGERYRELLQRIG